MAYPIKEYATFLSDLPDDSQEKDGEIVVPSGLGVATLLRSQLVSKGYVCGPVEQRAFYGWQFDCKIEDAAFLLVLQYVEPWLLIVAPAATWWQRILGGKADGKHRQLVESLSDVLEATKGLTNPAWFTKEEFEQGQRTPRR